MPTIDELLLRYKQVQSTENSKDSLIHVRAEAHPRYIIQPSSSALILISSVHQDLFAKLTEPQPGITELRQEFQTTLNNQLQLRDLQIANELEQLAQVTNLVVRLLSLTHIDTRCNISQAYPADVQHIIVV